jgi:ribosomal protein S18 acetylase RimI-like enzyme
MHLPIDWAAAEGWNPGRHDGECFFGADPNGFLVGLLDDKPIATISVVRYGLSFGFLGFYIVDSAFRGQGYGIKIWSTGLAHLEGRVVGLDGVVDQQENYCKSGFVLAYRNLRYEGAARASGRRDSRIVAIASLPLESVVGYDRALFPEERGTFIRCWIRQPEHVALGYLDDGRMQGYGVVRPCREAFKVGPLLADRPGIARSLLDALQNSIPPGATIYLDTPELNSAAVALAEEQGMHIAFETARMYRGPAPQLALDRIFGVTTFELG